MISSNSQIVASQLTNLSGGTRGKSAAEQSVSTGNVFRTGIRHLSSAFGNLPNPMYYMARLPGQMLPAVLLLSRAISAEGKSTPLSSAAQKADNTLKDGETEGIGLARLQDTDTDPRAAMIARLAEDGGEADMQRIIRSIDDAQQSDATPKEKNGRKLKRFWAVTALPDSLNKPIKDSDLTLDGKLVRTGIADTPDEHLTQRPAQDRFGKFVMVYRFAMQGAKNMVKQSQSGNCPDKAPLEQNSAHNVPSLCKTSSIPPKDSQYFSELSNCFHTDRSEPPVYDGLIKSAGMYLNNCPGAIPAGGTISGSMQVKIDDPATATIFQIRSMPDRLLYHDSAGLTYGLSRETSGASYDSLLADGMRFEPQTPVPFSINVELGGDSLFYLTIKARSDYSQYTNGDCNLVFDEDKTTINQAVCCSVRQQDVSYLYAKPLGFNHWQYVKYQIDFSDYSNVPVQPGRVQVFIDDKRVVNARLFIGVNNDPGRGGGGYYATFGIKDLQSYKPAVVKFRDVEFHHGKFPVPPEINYQPATNVTGQCGPN